MDFIHSLNRKQQYTGIPTVFQLEKIWNVGTCPTNHSLISVLDTVWLVTDDNNDLARGLTHLKGLTKLEHLGLQGTLVTDAGVAELKKALPKCIIAK